MKFNQNHVTEWWWFPFSPIFHFQFFHSSLLYNIGQYCTRQQTISYWIGLYPLILHFFLWKICQLHYNAPFMHYIALLYWNFITFPSNAHAHTYTWIHTQTGKIHSPHQITLAETSAFIAENNQLHSHFTQFAWNWGKFNNYLCNRRYKIDLERKK